MDLTLLGLFRQVGRSSSCSEGEVLLREDSPGEISLMLSLTDVHRLQQERLKAANLDARAVSNSLSESLSSAGNSSDASELSGNMLSPGEI